MLIDCPPSLNVLTVNAMTAADAVLAPMQCEFFALEGLSQLMRTIELVRGSAEPAGSNCRAWCSPCTTGATACPTQVAADVRAHFGDKVYATVIPRNVRVSEAPSVRQTRA